MKKFNQFLPKNFFICGLTGWCMEILFTSFKSLTRHDRKLQGQTSVWMFPIYGCAALIKPLYHLIRRFPTAVRGGIYSVVILTGEYLSGSLKNTIAVRGITVVPDSTGVDLSVSIMPLCGWGPVSYSRKSCGANPLYAKKNKRTTNNRGSFSCAPIHA